MPIHDVTLSSNVARAERELASATRLWNEAIGEAQKISKRISDLAAERSAIISRRMAGTAPPDSADRLVVIGADLEGLRGLLEAAREKADALEPEPQREALRIAQQRWEEHKNQVAFNAVAEQVARAEERFVAAVVRLHQAGQKVGRRHLSENYRPGLPLRTLVTDGMLPR